MTALPPGNLRHPWRRFSAGMKDAGRRNIYFCAMAIPGHLLMAGSKAVLLLFTFSAFMTANVLFTFGLAVIKLFVIRADRRARLQGLPSTIPRAYRNTGLVVLVLSAAYIVCCLPLALGTNTSDRYDENVAITIAAIAFTELGFAIHGFFTARKNKDVLMETVKLSNLAASLILLVLAQTALLSMTPETTVEPSRYNGICGVGFGVIAALIGIYMIIRSIRLVKPLVQPGASRNRQLHGCYSRGRWHPAEETRHAERTATAVHPSRHKDDDAASFGEQTGLQNMTTRRHRMAQESWR